MGKRKKSKSRSHLDAYARGQVAAYSKSGYSSTDIAGMVRKRDGSPATPSGVRKTIQKARRSPKWRGQDLGGPGRKKVITAKQQKQLVKLVFAKRGSKLVTIKFCRISYSVVCKVMV